MIWKTPAEHGCLAVILEQTFEHAPRRTRGTGHESRCFFRCGLRFWSVLANLSVQCQFLCFLFIQTVRTVTQTFTHCFRTKCRNVLNRLLELLLAVETKPISRCQCVFQVVRPRETFSVPCHFPVQELHGCQETRADAFTYFHLEHFTHQLFEVVRPVMWNAKVEIVSPTTKNVAWFEDLQLGSTPSGAGSLERRSSGHMAVVWCPSSPLHC